MSKVMDRAIVSRDRVVAPPDRFIAVDDTVLEESLSAYAGSLGDGEGLEAVQGLISGIVGHELDRLRREVEHELFLLGANPQEAGEKGHHKLTGSELDSVELQALDDIVNILHSCQYRMLNASEWDAAMSEDFLLTLPVTVDWSTLDTRLLRRYWAGHPEERRAAPPQLVDRVLIFHRGVEPARMQGYYYDLKIDALLSLCLLQPLWALLVFLAGLVGLSKYVKSAPPGMEAAPEGAGPESGKAAATAAQAHAQGELHPACISITRQTFARVLNKRRSILDAFFHKVQLQEACFKDVVVIYRKAVHGIPEPGELDIVHTRDVDMSRNLVLRHFSQIPLADLEMVMPDKNVFVPPTVFVQLLITAVTGLVAVGATLAASDKVTGAAVWTALTLLASRAYQVYAAALARRTAIEKQMARMLYERCTAAQDKVVAALVDEMNKQSTRELLVCYAILLSSDGPLSESELDTQCESFLADKFGLQIDFTSETAVATLREWGLITSSSGGGLQAVPVMKAVEILDGIWDNLYDVDEGILKVRSAGLAGLAKLLGRRSPGSPTATQAYGEEAAHSTGSGLDPAYGGAGKLESEHRIRHKGGLLQRIKKKVASL